MVLVDTNVVVDVWQRNAEWHPWSRAQLRAQSQVHELVINPIIYAELSLNFESIETLNARVAATRRAVPCRPSVSKISASGR